VNANLDRLACRNQLLNALPSTALSKLQRDLTCRPLHVRDRLVVRNEPIREVFFPLNCVLSTVAEGARGDPVEVATIGNEGMSGIAVFLGAGSMSTLETFTQVPGDALVLRAVDFRRHIDAMPRLRDVMGLYTQALLTQVSQAAACNRLHPADERMARWLLMTHDRVQNDDFELTQDFLAQMLGVRRATVSEIASELQSEGLIAYARGRISVRKRAELEELSCECYEIIRREYARLLPAPAAEA
jgi:CRP-like cAMP-binding protein